MNDINTPEQAMMMAAANEMVTFCIVQALMQGIGPGDMNLNAALNSYHQWVYSRDDYVYQSLRTTAQSMGYPA